MSQLEAEVPIIRPRWLNITEQPVVQLKFANDNKMVLAGLSDGQIVLIDYESGKTITSLQAHKMGLIDFNICPQKNKMASLGEDNFVNIYQVLPTGLELLKKWKSKFWVEQAIWKNEILYLSSGKNLYQWLMNEEEPRLIETWAHSISSLQFNEKEELGVAGYSRFCLYDTEDDFKKIKNFEWKGQLEKLVFSPRDRFAVCASNDLSIHIWDLKKDKDLAMRGFPQKITDLSFRKDGLYMANASGEEFMVWDYMDPGPAGKKPQVFGPFEKPVQFCKYQNKGKMLASFGQDGVVLFWRPDLFDDQPLAIAGIRDQAITAALWTNDDLEVITGLSTGFVACYPTPQVTEK